MLSLSPAALARETVPVTVTETCGKLTFDPDDQTLRFTNYRTPGKFPFRVSLLYGVTPHGTEAFQTVQKLFYQPQKPGVPADVDHDLIRTGVLVKIKAVEGSRIPVLKPNPKYPEKSFLSLSKETYLQIFQIEKIVAAECRPIEE
jgi:hypothetical protein